MQTKVSVIIPVYNVEQYLEKCLDSLCCQTLKEIEIICINDASSDNSLEILKEYAKHDNRIKIINLMENIGAAPARNKGLEIAKGEYIYFMDSDDWISEKYLEELYLSIEQSECDIVFNSNILYVKNGINKPFFEQQCRNIAQEGKIIDSKDEIFFLPCMAWCRLYRKSFLDKNKIKWQKRFPADDFVFHYISQFYVDKIWAYSGSPYFYRFNPNGLAQQEVTSRFVNAWSQILDYLTNENQLGLFNLKWLEIPANTIIGCETIYILYKRLFERIMDLNIGKASFFDNKLNKYVFNAVMNTENYKDFSKKYNAKIVFDFLKNNIKESAYNG